VSRLDGLPGLGFGAAQLGNLFRETTDEDSAAAVAAAWNAGIRYFDTAPHYGLGLSERRLGAALAAHPRAEYLVSTKVGRLLVPSPETATSKDTPFEVPAGLRREWDFSRSGILRSLESSLSRLGLDRVDIVYLHDPDDQWDEASTTGFAALAELRDQGAVRAIGVGMNQSAMLAEFVRRCDIDVVMLAGRFTLLDQSALDDLLPLALDHDVAVVAAGVYNSGLLSRPDVSMDAHYDYVTAPAKMVARAQAIAALCQAHGVALPAAAVQFPLRHPAVQCVVVGARTATHVRDAITRSSAHIPGRLWDELVDAGLIVDLASPGETP
jgi:D-threo-aldose 1-dehydrogenase